MIKASDYRNNFTVIFRDAEGKVVLSMSSFARTAKEAIKQAVTYGNPPPYHTVGTK